MRYRQALSAGCLARFHCVRVYLCQEVESVWPVIVPGTEGEELIKRSN